MLFTHFYLFLCQEKKQKPGLYLQQERNTLALNPQNFCQEINNKNTLFFYRCSYKKQLFQRVVVQLQCPCVNLIICSLLLEIQKRCSYLKNVTLDFVLLVLKLYPIQVVILLLFLCIFRSFFQIRRKCPSNQPFFTVTDWYILAIQQTLTHDEHLRYSF